MRRDIALAFLIVTASALCWLPVSMEPSLDLSSWIPPVCAAVCAGLATALSGNRWPLFLFAAGLGTFADSA